MTLHNEKRKQRAAEAFQNAAITIGPISAGMSLFAMTRGQFSMIDAVLHCLNQLGSARITIWTWCIAEYEVMCFDRLRMDSRITSALLVIDSSAQKRNAPLLNQWRHSHGVESVRYVVNHAKIATLQNEHFRLLLRGSMNLNYNPRFEQFDISEGCAGFNLIQRIENELPILPPQHSYKDLRTASKLDMAFTNEQLLPFSGVRTWAK